MEFTTSCLPSCAPAQVVNFTYAFNFEDLSNIQIINDCSCCYENSALEWAYSLDSSCWSCYMSYNELLESTIGINQDFYIRIKVNGSISAVKFNNEEFNDYTTSLFQNFSFTSDSSQYSANLYNPYANMDCAIGLQQQLAETVANMFGVPIYYFKLSPNVGSKDITFKEYALMDVESVKQIKLIIQDGTMPSSRPEFSDFGLDFQTDWETEISKGMFATAFGNTAQPMEGDLIYIPMMKRMWMVNEAYEEKNEGVMWNATTFKVMLVKYQEKASVDLGDTESLVNSFVKNKYEDLFGDQEPLDSGMEVTAVSQYAGNRLYPVFESDATRKYMTCEPIEYNEESQYYKGTLITDLRYKFNTSLGESTITYQRQYCGDSGTISFIFMGVNAIYEGTIFEMGSIKIHIKQLDGKITLTLINNSKFLELESFQTYFVYVRWSKAMNNIEFTAIRYTYNHDIPLYKLQPYHYYFDVDNPEATLSKWNIEMVQETRKDIIVHGLEGYMTNIKVFDIYNDNISEIMQMYPTNQHLLVNDTARKIVNLSGIALG